MNKHITIVGVLFIGYGAVMMLAALILALLLSSAGLVVTSAANGQTPAWILVSIGLGVAVLLVLFGVPDLVGGIGLMKMRPWVRIMVLILAALNLFNLPVGTAIGVYTLWALTKDETVQLFEPGKACC